MSWLSMFVFLYLAALGLLLLFLTGASLVNQRADFWADSLSDYLAYKEEQRRAA